MTATGNTEKPERIYLDAIDEALKTAKSYRTRVTRNLAEDVAVRQIRQSERIRKHLDKQMRDSLVANPEWAPSPDYVRMSAENSRTIASLLTALRMARSEQRKTMAGLTDEQLDKVFIHQLHRVALNMTREHWHSLLRLKFGTEVADLLAPLKPSPQEEAP